MTRYKAPEALEKKSPLLSVLPAVNPIDSNYKSSIASSSASSTSSADAEELQVVEDGIMEDGSEFSESCATATSCSEEPVEEEIIVDTAPINNNTNGIRDVYKNPIPLPAPSGSYAMGTACGGNQSYVGLKDTVRRLPDPNISQDYLDGGYNSTENTSVTIRSPGIVGLNNLGNTCFMNSGLQCLINTAPVVEFFLKSENISGVAPIKTALVAQFQGLIRNAWLGASSTLSLQEFKNVLGNNYSQFKDCRQHDCQEFLALTLDVLHEQLKTWNSLKKGGECLVNGSSSSKSASSPINDSDSKISTPEWVDKDANKEETRTKVQTDSPQMKRRKINVEEGTAMSEEEPEAGAQDLMVNGHDELDYDRASNNISLEEQAEQASEFWTSYIKDNNTVIASSFQGMYKSTVTCSECQYISRTYEPFMYLSLPIPRMMERQFAVTFSSYQDARVNKVDVTLTVGDTVGRLKEEVLKKVHGDVQLGIPLSAYVVAEVVNHHVYRVLEDDAPLKSVYDGNRNIYVYELNQNFDDLSETVVYGPSLEVPTSSVISGDSFQSQLNPSTYLDEDWETDAPAQQPTNSSQGFVSSQADSGFSASPTTNSHPGNFELLPCAVCLEDLVKSELRQHYGCSCILCIECMKKTASHHKEQDKKNEKSATMMKCPVCAIEVDYEKSFLPLADNKQGSLRKLTIVPLLFRHDPVKDANNNSPVVTRLFNHPSLVKLPSIMNATEFNEFIKSINPFPDHDYKVVNASWDGKTCGQCVYAMSCRGCELPSDGLISINPRNSVLISYSNLSMDLVDLAEPPDMAIQTGYMSNLGWTRKEEPPIDIHECLHAFSEIEYLDEQNPWNCPRCKENRCATKALTICRFPDYLIVYLKRFVFVDQSSNKLNNQLQFPTNDLDVSQYIAEEFSGTEHVYDLYSCVCHYGTASSGHYTAFGKNPVNGSWNYFNDENCTSKIPSEPEFASAYVLFYERKGLKSDIPLSRRASPVIPRFRFTSSFLGDRDASKETLPESSNGFPIGNYGVTISEENVNDVIGCLPIDQREELISAQNDDSDREPKLYHKTSCTSTADLPDSPNSSEKLNGVREDVSRLHLKCNDNSVRRKQPIKCKDSLTAFRFRETMDDVDEVFATPGFLKKTSVNDCILTNSRPTKVAARPKNPHPGNCTDHRIEN